MKFFDVICKRTSVREYKNDLIDKRTIEKLIDAGRRAPTARGEEPWEFVVVLDRKMLKRFSELAVNGSFVKNAAVAIVVFCHDTKYYLEDGCAATENILLSAADAGLGACWIAGDKKDYAEEICGLLKAPKDCKLISIIAIGIPLKEKHQVKKRSIDQVLHWEKFL